jgi:hypothetical protein
MRVLAAMTFAIALVGLAAPSQAGLLELPFDRITLHRACASEPCSDNDLHRKRVYVRDRYLRFDIHTTPARYATRRTRALVGLPNHYVWVNQSVLVSPAHSTVSRRRPHFAYYSDTIIVSGR